MATPNRKLILDDVFASLQAIDGDGTPGTYKTRAVTVERRLIAADEVPPARDDGSGGTEPATPWYGVVPIGTERLEYRTGGWVGVTLSICVVGAYAIPPNDPADPQDDDNVGLWSANLLDDIMYALSGTAEIGRRGTHVDDVTGRTVNNASSTTIVEQWTAEGIEAAESLESGHVIAYAIARAEVRYDRRRTHS
jgi:hypothetical protein